MKNIFKRINTKLLFLVLTLSVPSLAYAQSGAPPKITDGSLTDIFNKIFFDIGYPLAFLVGVIMVIVAGYMWMTSAGDAQKIQTAQGTITWAVLGLIFLSVFQLILKGIFTWLGV
jgi:type IV secretory pathway VirB2 component (pilin)